MFSQINHLPLTGYGPWPKSPAGKRCCPAINRKPEEFSFDLDGALESVVALRAVIPPDAFTASILGAERAGSGVVIRESGLVLTIGYLITEAESVWLTGANGRVTAAHPLAYDQETGFGLVQALGRLGLPALDLGSASQAKLGDPAIWRAAAAGNRCARASSASRNSPAIGNIC